MEVEGARFDFEIGAGERLVTVAETGRRRATVTVRSAVDGSEVASRVFDGWPQVLTADDRRVDDHDAVELQALGVDAGEEHDPVVAGGLGGRDVGGGVGELRP